MNAVNEAIIRQMLIINKLDRAGMPVSADNLMAFLENHAYSHPFPYPENRKSRMRLLQRDINSIRNTFKIDIARSGRSEYEIKSKDIDWAATYERLFNDFDLLTAIHPDVDINKYVKPERSRNKGSEHLFVILKAIKDRSIIEFDYVNYRAGCREKHHRLAPHFLKEDQGLWYVGGYVIKNLDYGNDENDYKRNTLKYYGNDKIKYNKDKLLLFGLDRIRNLDITDDEFIFDASLDPNESFKDSYGIWADPATPTEEVELRYDALDGSFLKARPLHPSQKVIVDNTDEFRITLRLKITNDFVMALLSRARSLEVIRPAHLRERIRSTLSDALTRNS